jgi:hypothetical protein
MLETFFLFNKLIICRQYSLRKLNLCLSIAFFYHRFVQRTIYPSFVYPYKFLLSHEQIYVVCLLTQRRFSRFDSVAFLETNIFILFY